MIDTLEIAVTLRVPVAGESTRGGIVTLVRGFGGSLPRNFLIYGCLYLHFNAFWTIISALFGRFGTGGICISVMEH